MSDVEVAEQKRRLRRRVGDAVRALPPEDVAERSRRIAERLFACRCWREAEIVYCYASFAGEVQTGDIRRRAESEGRRVALPRVSGRSMRFHDVTGSTRALERSAFGIDEPAADLPVVEPGPAAPGAGASGPAASLVLVPGLAFDADGGRLGRGGGFYDRFLSAFSGQCLPLGLCFEVQLVEAVPRTEGDVRVAGVMTEQRVIRRAGSLDHALLL